MAVTQSQGGYAICPLRHVGQPTSAEHLVMFNKEAAVAWSVGKPVFEIQDHLQYERRVDESKWRKRWTDFTAEVPLCQSFKPQKPHDAH